MLTDIKTMYASYKVDFLSVDTYMADNSLAITAWSRTDGPIAHITVCLDANPMKENQAYVDTYNCPWAPAWIEENKLGTRTNWRARSGYRTYPLYEFDMERIEEERAKA